jgi:hypothetical protein
MRTRYEPTMTVAAARDRYFAVNGFGADGGYGDPWVDFKLGPLPMPFPNPPARVRAVKYHDLHHVLTDYDTDTIGEFEIAAWEIAAGCKGFAAAWVLNLGGMVGGLVSAPRRTFRAYVRGRRMQSLYGRDYEELLGKRVSELRAAVEGAPRPVGVTDVLGFALASAAGIAVAVPLFAIMLVAAPIGLVTYAFRRRARA